MKDKYIFNDAKMLKTLRSHEISPQIFVEAANQ
jgi:hypothetical protein